MAYIKSGDDKHMYVIRRWLTNERWWMDDLRFYVLFNNISVISGQWEVDNERLCAMELRLRLSRFRFERGSNSDR